MRPSIEGSGVIAGGAVRIVLEVAGVKNVIAKQLRSNNLLNNSRASICALKNLTTLGFEKFVFCLSFEDPLLKLFASQNILPLLEKLGLEEEEAIEHAMVTKSIQRAREKVESTVNNEIHTKSPEEWFALNAKR